MQEVIVIVGVNMLISTPMQMGKLMEKWLNKESHMVARKYNLLFQDINIQDIKTCDIPKKN